MKIPVFKLIILDTATGKTYTGIISRETNVVSAFEKAKRSIRDRLPRGVCPNWDTLKDANQDNLVLVEGSVFFEADSSKNEFID